MQVMGTAMRLVGAPASAAFTLASLPRRVVRTLVTAEDTVQRAATLLLRAEMALDRLTVLDGEIDELVGAVAGVTRRADEVAGAAAQVAVESASVAQAAATVTDQIQGLLSGYAPAAKDAAPAVRALAEEVTPDHVRSLVAGLELLPQMLRSAVPAVEGLAQLSLYLDELSGRLDDVGQIVEGIPGAKMLRRRGQQDGDDS